jgi:hypothetical protein
MRKLDQKVVQRVKYWPYCSERTLHCSYEGTLYEIEFADSRFE